MAALLLSNGEFELHSSNKRLCTITKICSGKGQGTKENVA